MDVALLLLLLLLLLSIPIEYAPSASRKGGGGGGERGVGWEGGLEGEQGPLTRQKKLACALERMQGHRR